MFDRILNAPLIYPRSPWSQFFQAESNILSRSKDLKSSCSMSRLLCSLKLKSMVDFGYHEDLILRMLIDTPVSLSVLGKIKLECDPLTTNVSIYKHQSINFQSKSMTGLYIIGALVVNSLRTFLLTVWLELFMLKRIISVFWKNVRQKQMFSAL